MYRWDQADWPDIWPHRFVMKTKLGLVGWLGLGVAESYSVVALTAQSELVAELSTHAS
jgi:hypothetical protein